MYVYHSLNYRVTTKMVFFRNVISSLIFYERNNSINKLPKHLTYLLKNFDNKKILKGMVILHMDLCLLNFIPREKLY